MGILKVSDKSRKKLLRASFVVTSCLGLVLLSVSCTKGCSKDGWQPTTFDRFLLRLQNHHRKDVSYHKYSVDFIGTPPSEVTIQITYEADADKRKMRESMNSAKELVLGMARDEYGLRNIKVEEVWRPIERPND